VIKNDRQYGFNMRLLRVLRMQRRLLVDHVCSKSSDSCYRDALDEHDRRIDAVEDALAEYRLTRSWQSGAADLRSLALLEELAVDLIRARIRLGWSHGRLGALVGIKSQQIQRYEATDYRSARFDRVVAIGRALAAGLVEAGLAQAGLAQAGLQSDQAFRSL